MPKGKRNYADEFVQLELLKIEYLNAQKKALSLDHDEVPGRHASLIVPCKPECAACAATKRMNEAGVMIRDLERRLHGEAVRRAIDAAVPRAVGGAKAARERSYDEVVDKTIRHLTKEKGRIPRWNEIQIRIRKETEELLCRRRMPPSVLLQARYEGDIRQALENKVGAVHVRRDWLKLPSRSVIERRLKEVRQT